MSSASGYVLGIDWGEVRTGLALASLEAQLPARLATLKTSALLEQLPVICREHGVETVVMGLPRGLDGQETAQTQKARQFAKQLEATLDLAIVLQDEAATSVVAEERLRRQGSYRREDIDQEAAVILLEDYLSSL